MLKPLGDRVIVEVQKEEEKTVGGIVLASNVQEKPQTGKVIAVGEGTYFHNGKLQPMSVEVGQLVLFEKFAGAEVQYEGQKYLVLHEKDLIAVVA